MEKGKKHIVYIEHGNELVVSKLRVLIDSLIKYQNGYLPASDMLYDAFTTRILRYNGQLCFDDYIITFEQIHYSKCLSLREYLKGITVEYYCDSLVEDSVNSKDVLTWLLSIFIDIEGIVFTPVWGLTDIFDDAQTIDKQKVKRNLKRAYRRSTSPVCYIESDNRLLPIYGKKHAEQIAKIYNDQEGTHCQSRLNSLLDANKIQKLTYNLKMNDELW